MLGGIDIIMEMSGTIKNLLSMVAVFFVGFFNSEIRVNSKCFVLDASCCAGYNTVSTYK